MRNSWCYIKNFRGEILGSIQIIPIINNFESRYGNEGTHNRTDSDENTQVSSNAGGSDER